MKTVRLPDGTGVPALGQGTWMMAEDPTGSRFTTIPRYTVVNGSVGYRSAAGWELAVFARNLSTATIFRT